MTLPFSSLLYWSRLVLSISVVVVTWAEPLLAQPSNADFEQFKQQNVQAYKQFVAEQDKQFAAYLDEQWTSFKSFKSHQREDKPKPSQQPKKQDKSYSSQRHQALRYDSIWSKTKSFINDKVVDPLIKSTPVDKKYLANKRLPQHSFELQKDSVQLNFYAHELNILFDTNAYRQALKGLGKKFDKRQAAEWWLKLSALDNKKLLEQLEEYRQTLALSDWALIELVQLLSRCIYSSTTYSPKSTRADWNAQQLLSGFLLLRLGFDIKLAESHERLLLLFNAQQKVYSIPFFDIEGDTYYVLNHDQKNNDSMVVSTVPNQYSAMQQTLDLSFKKTFNLAKATQWDIKVLSNDIIQLPLAIALQRVSYFENYPSLDIDYYFQIKVLKPFFQPISREQGSQFYSLPIEQKINQLLQLVQQLNYQTDIEQFGQERYLSPEQALFYPASDCEDRSFLFIQLVKQFTPLTIVGLVYDNHATTGLAIDSSTGNDKFRFRGKLFSHADPTYLGAKLGEVMPLVANKKPRVVPIKL